MLCECCNFCKLNAIQPISLKEKKIEEENEVHLILLARKQEMHSASSDCIKYCNVMRNLQALAKSMVSVYYNYLGVRSVGV